MDYAEIKQRVNMHMLANHYGIEVRRNRSTCPIHGGDNKDAFCIHNDGQGWTCFTKCNESGDIFTFVERMERIDNAQARIKIMDMFNLDNNQPIQKKPAKKPKAAVVSRVEYIYRDEKGNEAFKVLRVDYADGKKDCYQECEGRPTLPEAKRTLYNLDKISGNSGNLICLCEGEKTADAVTKCGYIGTTNPLGSKNWNSKYAELLRDQNVVVMPDADEHGEKWRDEVVESLCGVVEQLQVVNIPTEFIKAHPEFSGHDFADYLECEGDQKAMEFIVNAIMDAPAMPRGVDPNLLGMPCDIWKDIVKRAQAGINTNVFNLSEWLPSMNVNIKQGDLLVIMANTSTGKTRILHNIPFHIRRLNYVIFDLELSRDTLAMRYAAMENMMSMTSIETRLNDGLKLRDVNVDNVFIQKVDGLTVEKIKERVELIERVTGKHIHVIAVDYIGLMSGRGTSYEVTSNNVEAFKSYIGASDKCGILTTQVSRPEHKENGMFECPSPFSAKNSGSVENSAQTLLGIWKDKHIQNRLHVRCIKHTHGSGPTEDIPMDANDLLITQAT